MKLQKQITRKSTKKTYYKYVIILPPEVVKKLGWRTGIELGTMIEPDALNKSRKKLILFKRTR